MGYIYPPPPRNLSEAEKELQQLKEMLGKMIKK
jgi:hypothetical protein